MSRRVEKSFDYHQRVRENELAFAESGLPRPQDAYRDVMFRSRQVNFNLAPSLRRNVDEVLEWRPAAFMTCSRMNFECYGGNPQTLHGQWIRDSEQFEDLMKKLLTEREFALDMEGHNEHSVNGIISLLQVSTWNYGDFLVDPFTIKNELSTVFKTILEDSSILKISHGAQNDLLWLQRDFDVHLNGFIDTQILFKVWKTSNIPSRIQTKPNINNPIGLKALISLFHPELEKLSTNETLSEWRLRPDHGFTRSQEIYAVNDVHPLLRIFDQMRSEVSLHELERAFEDSKQMLLKSYNPVSTTRMDGNNEIVTAARLELKKLSTLKGQIGFDVRETAIRILENNDPKFMSLMEWRQTFSRVIDEQPNGVLPTTTLIRLSQLQHPSLEEVVDLCGNVAVTVKPQTKIIRNLLCEEDYIEKLRLLECHNCLKGGHGPAWACPFPRNHENHKIWMSREENKSAKQYQNARRRKNWEKKTGGFVFRK